MFTGFILWAMIVAGGPKIDSIVCREVPDYGGMSKQDMTDLFWTKTVCDTFPKPTKIDSVFVLPHDTVVCRLSDSIDYIIATYPAQPHYVTICDTIRIGNYWQYRTIRGKDTGVWLQKKPN